MERIAWMKWQIVQRRERESGDWSRLQGDEVLDRYVAKEKNEEKQMVVDLAKSMEMAVVNTLRRWSNKEGPIRLDMHTGGCYTYGRERREKMWLILYGSLW